MNARSEDIIFSAITDKNIHQIKTLINKEIANLAALNSTKKTPIEFAAEQGYWEGVKAIAEAKDANDQDEFEDKGSFRYGSALYIAVNQDEIDIEIVRVLLKAKASINWRDSYTKKGVMHIAIDRENISVGKLLLEAGIDLTKKTKVDGLEEEYTPIEYASECNKWEAVDYIAENISDNEDDAANFGSALIYAVKAKRLHTAELLIKNNADKTWRSSTSNNYCMHWAVINNDFPMLKLLLENGFNMTSKNRDHQVPLELACSLGHWECAEAFITQPSFTFVPGRRHAALLQAVIAKRSRLVAFLLKAGASLVKADILDDKGNSCLHWATRNDDDDMIMLLLENGAEQTAINHSNKTPIRLACEESKWKTAQLLIENISDINRKEIIKNLQCKEALESAVNNNNYLVTQLLLEKGVPCNGRNSECGNITLYNAIANKNPIMVELLLSYSANPDDRNQHGKNMSMIANDLGAYECAIKIEEYKKHKNTLMSKYNGSPLNSMDKQLKKYLLTTLLPNLLTIPLQEKNIFENMFGLHNESDDVRDLIAVITNMQRSDSNSINSTFTKALDTLHKLSRNEETASNDHKSTPYTDKYNAAKVFYRQTLEKTTTSQERHAFPPIEPVPLPQTFFPDNLLQTQSSQSSFYPFLPNSYLIQSDFHPSINENIFSEQAGLQSVVQSAWQPLLQQHAELPMKILPTAIDPVVSLTSVESSQQITSLPGYESLPSVSNLARFNIFTEQQTQKSKYQKVSNPLVQTPNIFSL